MTQEHNNLIHGEWVAGTAYTPNVNPSNTADVQGHYTQASAAQLDCAVQAARVAFTGWSISGIQSRADALDKIGIKATKPRASLYIWARVPDGYTSVSFANKLLDELAVEVTPGIGYGPSGEGYIRISLTVPDKRLDEALARIAAWH